MTIPLRGVPTITSCGVRAELVEALRLDLVGPSNAHPLAREPLLDAPSRWYMCGSPKGYRREPREESVTIALPKPGGKPKEFPVPNSRGLTVSVTVRAVPAAGQTGSHLPAGTRSVSVFLVKNRPPSEERHYRTFAFQTLLTLNSSKPFVTRPD